MKLMYAPQSPFARKVGAAAIELGLGCLLGYIDFRWPDTGWRESRPHLAGWFAGL